MQSDVEDMTVTLESDEYSIRSVLDTLTSCCMQMAELLQSGEQNEDVAAANQLASLLKKSKKQASLPTADQVEFWKSPEKEGWMYSQGEHIKTWRKRWFILKQGFLFRFASPDVEESTKPRGIVDLSQVTDVADGNSTTGRPLSIKLSTASGVSKCYITESETAQVEWISALEGAVAKILKIVAGLDEEEEEHRQKQEQARISGSRSLEQQLRNSLSSAMQGSKFTPKVENSGSRTNYSNKSRFEGSVPQTINIINYHGDDPGAPVMSSGQGFSAGMYPPAEFHRPSAPDFNQNRPGYGGQYINVDYTSTSGVAGAHEAPTEQQMPYEQATVSYQSSGPHQGDTYYAGLEYPNASSGTSFNQIQYGRQIEAPYAGQISGYGDMKEQHPYTQAPEFNQSASQYSGSSGIPQQPMDGQATLLDSVTVPNSSSPAPSPIWQTHHTQDGRPYYYNTVTGITQWEPPEA